MNDASETFLNPAIPLPFCPGCGGARVVEALDRALVSTGLPPESIVIVTDIGCTGLSDRHFRTNAFFTGGPSPTARASSSQIPISKWWS